MRVIESTIDTVTSLLPPELPDGFVIDAEHYFGQHPAFERVAIRKTSKPKNMIEIDVVAAATTPSLHAIKEGLTDVWRKLAYMNYGSMSVLWFKEAMVLRFVTVGSAETYCVTGTVRATSANFAELVARHENDFKIRLDHIIS